MRSPRTRRGPRPRRSGGALALLGVTLLLVGCGGDDAAQVVRETQAKLGEIRSGQLSMRVEVAAHGGGGPVGLRLQGPFSLASPGPLPVARVRYTQLAGAERAVATLVSTGRRAYVELDGTPYRLPRAREDELADALGGRDRGRGLDALGLDLAEWIEEPRLEEVAGSAGHELERVTGRVDVVAALRDVLSAAGQATDEGFDIDERTVEGIRKAVRSSSIELVTGVDDRLLRRLRLELDFQAPARLQPLLGGLRGGRLLFALQIERPNQAIRVDEPTGAQPASAIGIE